MAKSPSDLSRRRVSTWPSPRRVGASGKRAVPSCSSVTPLTSHQSRPSGPVSCQSSREEPSFTSGRICSTRLREAGTRMPFVTASAKSLLGASESTFTSTPSLSTVMRVQAVLRVGEGLCCTHTRQPGRNSSAQRPVLRTWQTMSVPPSKRQRAVKRLGRARNRAGKMDSYCIGSVTCFLPLTIPQFFPDGNKNRPPHINGRRWSYSADGSADALYRGSPHQAGISSPSVTV